MSKIILSRKGFDSSFGGVASPIFPDRNMISLPIPASKAPLTYDDIQYKGGRLGEIVTNLTKEKVSGQKTAHLDPDLCFDSRERLPGWKPAFGQVGAAQTHLENNQISVGDLFLFFGWFRKVEEPNGGHVFARNARHRHVIFGWLEIGEIIDVAADEESAIKRHKWLKEHPHLHGMQTAKNVIYVATDHLSNHYSGRQTLKGGGQFLKFSDHRELTAPNASGRSQWQLPAWFMPEGRPPLTFHENAGRWEKSGDHVTLKSVAIGQEFVLDCDYYPEAMGWIQDLFSPHENTTQRLNEREGDEKGRRSGKTEKLSAALPTMRRLSTQASNESGSRLPKSNEFSGTSNIKLCSYIIKNDTGLAPNPFGKYCTLALCTPNHMNATSKPGHWIAGFSPKSDGYRLVYAMLVNERLTFDEYYRDPRFSEKKPKPQGTAEEQCGDNFYFQKNGYWWRLPSGFHPSQKAMLTDLRKGQGAPVFVSEHYFYYGKSRIDLPSKFQKLICKGRGTRTAFDESLVRKFVEWVEGHVPGKHAEPLDFDGPKNPEKPFRVIACKP